MDVKLFYTDNGPKSELAPMILLHGNGGNSSSFFYVVDYFCKFRRVITLDTRGHGRSPKGEGAFTLKRFADDLYKFMGEMDIKKAVLVGYSDGGNIAMIFANQHPEMVEGLVLNGANMFPSGLKDKDMRWIMSSYKKAKKSLRRSPQNEHFKNELDLLSLMVNEPRLTKESFSGVDAPTLVLVGSRDVIKPEHTEYIVSSFKNSYLAVVEGGHNIVKTNSEPYIAAIDGFLKKANI